MTGQVILGIDLGTTNSAVAIWRKDLERVEVIPDADGQPLLPSVVAWDGNGWVVGRAAEAVRQVAPDRAAFSVKRLIGRAFEDAAADLALLPYRLVRDDTGDPLREVAVGFGPPGGPVLTAPEVSAKLLGQLRENAAVHLGRPLDDVRDAVITIPAYFDDLQRRATRYAGELAGLRVLDLLHEPTAAALAYAGLVLRPEERWVIVLDLGGGTFDVSLLEASRPDDGGYVFATRGVDGDTRLGGDDIDAALAGWLAARVKEGHGVAPDRAVPATQDALCRAAREAKVRLSAVTETTIDLPDLAVVGGGTVSSTVPVTRAVLEELRRARPARVREITARAVEDAGVTWAQVAEVILVGGQTAMPVIRSEVEELAKRPPRWDCPPELAVVLGAGEYAGILGRGAARFHENTLINVIARPLGVRLDGDLFEPLIKRNATLPAVSEPFPVTTRENNQVSIRVDVLQGDRGVTLAKECVQLGSLEMRVPPAKAGVLVFEITFEGRLDGTLRVAVTDRQGEGREVLDIVGRHILTLRGRDAAAEPG